jgi:glycosyltransferase involved in cell wall biosynthesis
MQALCDELGLRGIHFAGHQPQPEVARIYNAADVSVVPSRVEPFGLVAIEALACGTPVVATDMGGLPDFINQDVGVLVPVDDPQALAEAIIEEIQGNTKETKGVYASQYALDGFSWTGQVSRMADLYRQAVESTTRQGN